MKICWDSLEKLTYSCEIGKWYNKYQTLYIYKNSCKSCGESFLSQKDGKFCDKSCANNGKNNPNYGKELSKNHKQKISKSHKPHPCSQKTKQKISKSLSKNGHGFVQRNIPLYDTYAPQISFCEQIRKNKQDSNILEVKCAYCGKWYIPTMISVVSRIQALNGKGTGENRLYCSTECKQECPIYNQRLYPKGFKQATSREVQPELRQMCFERDEFICQRCSKHQDELDVGLHCHHIEGIRWEPLESADLDKVITLCKTCHKEVHMLPDCGYHDLRCK